MAARLVTEMMRRRAPAILLLLAFLVALDFHPWSRRTTQAVSEWSQFALALGAGLLCIRAALRSRPRGRTFWFLIGVAMLFWAAGQACWAIEEVSLSPQGVLTIWDVLFFCSAAPLLLAVGMRPDRPDRVGSSLAFDLVLVLTLGLHLYLYFGFELQSGGETGVPWLVGVAALRGVAVLGAFWYLVSSAAPPWRRVFADVTIGLVVLHVGDVASTWLLLAGHYEPGLPDLGWTLSFAWIGLAARAWDPATEDLTVDEPPVVPEWAGSRRGAVLAILAVVLVPALYFLTPRGGERSRGMHDEPLARQRGILALITTVTVGGLFLFRQLQILRRVERAQTQREMSFRLLFRNNPHPMLVYDRATLRLLEVNESLLHHYGYSRDEFLSMAVRDLIPDEDVGRLIELLQGQGPLRHTKGWRHRLKDGRTIEVETVAHDLEFGHRPATLVVATDVSERRQLEDQLRQAAKMEALGRLAGGIAHDFNNVLQAIVGYTSLLFRLIDDNDPAHKPVVEIDSAAERARRLVRQLLAFSRRQVLNPRTLELDGLLHDLDSMLRRLIGEDVALFMSIEPGLGRIRADRGQMEQVVLNLAVNARDTMPRGGRLTIEARNVRLDEVQVLDNPRARPGPYVMLAVSDTGEGMSAEILEHVFEPFYTTKGLGEGTGLGLSMVYGITTQSGGHVTVESQPGRGTTFRVYLPRVPDFLTQPAAPAGRAAAVGGSETILLVEDETPVREVTRILLEELGYRVLEAGSGAEALRVAESHRGPIHLLLSDVVMPGMSGPEMARRLVAARPETKVLYASGYANAVGEAELVEPAAALIEKPFRADALDRRIRAVLEGR